MGYTVVKNYRYGDDTYTGQVIGTRKYGTGVYTWANGDKYEGFWFMDEQHGEGLLSFKNGGYHKGRWERGKFQGFATRVYADGRAIQGTWSEGVLHGQVTWFDSTGTSYFDGEYERGCVRRGTLFFPGGVAQYQGELIEVTGKFMRHGQGRMKYKDGGVYVGQWQNDKRNGQGVMSTTEAEAMLEHGGMINVTAKETFTFPTEENIVESYRMGIAMAREP